MGVFRLYTEIVTYLSAQSNRLTEQSLDRIASVYSPFAYIGNRKSLHQVVLRDAERLWNCPRVPGNKEPNDLAAWWFGQKLLAHTLLAV